MPVYNQVPIVLGLHNNPTNPTDGQTLYYAGNSHLTTATAQLQNFYVPDMTITDFYLAVTCVTTIGSSETSTFSIRVNNTTDNTVSSSITHDSFFAEFEVNNLSVSVSKGDSIEIKVEHPTWTTNPAGVYYCTTLIGYLG